jgi:hypothetical protein
MHRPRLVEPHTDKKHHKRAFDFCRKPAIMDLCHRLFFPFEYCFRGDGYKPKAAFKNWTCRGIAVALHSGTGGVAHGVMSLPKRGCLTREPAER